MKNVIVTVELHRVLKTWVVSLLVFSLVVSNSAFKSEDEKSSSQQTLTAKNKINGDLFVGPFNPSKPYAQLNPKVVPFVRKYIQTEGARLEKMRLWGKRYFDIYDRVLSEYGLPKELKYLSVVESDLTSKALSHCGAVGPWQIMEEQAVSRGLKVNSRIDERTNFRKSTHAAAKIMRDLYNEFHDWPLVIAAYNCGDGRIRQAIRKSGSRNFWHLYAYLPPETRSHVKRFIATHYIFEGSGGLTTMTASEIKHSNLKAIAALQVRQLEEWQVKM